jgi:hypothetical protein
VKYVTENKDLVVQDDLGRELWRGKPEGYDVVWASPISGSDDGLVFYTYYRPEKRYQDFQNLVRVRSDGSIVWRAQLPSSNDNYYWATLGQQGLTGLSSGGYSACVDIATGRLVESKFVK